MKYCFEVRFRTSRLIEQDKLEEVCESTTFKVLRLWRPTTVHAKIEGWLAITSCGYTSFDEAKDFGRKVQDAVLIRAAQRHVGVEFFGRGQIDGMNVYPEGWTYDEVNPGTPPPPPLKTQELTDMMAAVAKAVPTLTERQRIGAALLNSSFFEISPEAQFLLRIAAVEALCPQHEETTTFKGLVDELITLLRTKPKSWDRNRVEQALKERANRQSVRSAYKAKIGGLLSEEKARKFESLYNMRSDFLHEGEGRGTFSGAAQEALDLCLELLLADTATSIVP